MPLIIPKDIPSYKLLKDFIFIIDEKRAISQDIRPLEILIFNLMPKKIKTENQLLSLLGNSPLQINITLLTTSSYTSKNTPQQHLKNFYVNFKDIKNKNFDGAIITGAPLEKINFKEVKYWNELIAIMDYLKKHCTSTLYLCWGAMAALYYFHKITKINLKNKLFGIFKHEIINKDMLLNGLDSNINMPHSRYFSISEKQIKNNNKLKILLKGKNSGITMLKDEKDIFILGHPEYCTKTLDEEYKRDLKKGLKISKPKNYYDKNQNPILSWRASSSMIFLNWLNFVYQTTPYKN